MGEETEWKFRWPDYLAAPQRICKNYKNTANKKNKIENFKKYLEKYLNHTRCLRNIPKLIPATNVKVRCLSAFPHNFMMQN